MRTVIFDLDGTLADTSADLIAAANACFRAMGHGDLLDPACDALTAFHGGRAMLRLGLARVATAEEAVDELLVSDHYPRLLDHYRRDIMVHTRAYPGAIAAVEALKARGFAVGICTNKPADLAEALLAKMGVRQLFGSMIGADTLPVRKPDPAPYVAAVERAGGQVARSMLVGDTETDRRTAAAAGVPVALVTFGPEGAGIARLSPEALLDHFDDLPDLAERLVP
ncbi:HAD-IA family hydrolase [Frigidibacter oleivorans]|uniref:HAD-IA family hydrolase n=1 Tax=Frigidibacter oleivorans TaxID=2487129 RepID=UPI000F8D3CB6|nr:HAD-IA family hydrolase [Frigidibacter oleivorans]